MNNTPTRITGKKPDEAIEMKDVSIEKAKYKRAVGFNEKRLDSFVKARYLYAPGEDEGEERRRTTVDPIWMIQNV